MPSGKQHAQDRKVAVLVIGLALLARTARHRRTFQFVIVSAIAVAAVAGMAREGQTQSFERMANWIRRHS
jgi:hypothetical protein